MIAVYPAQQASHFLFPGNSIYVGSIVQVFRKEFRYTGDLQACVGKNSCPPTPLRFGDYSGVQRHGSALAMTFG